MVWTNYNYLSLDRRRYYFHNILNNLIDLMCHTQSPENILCIVLRSIYRHLYKNVIMGKHAKIPFIWTKYNLWNKTRNYKLVTIKTYYIILLPQCSNLMFMMWRLYKMLKLDTIEHLFTIKRQNICNYRNISSFIYKGNTFKLILLWWYLLHSWCIRDVLLPKINLCLQELTGQKWYSSLFPSSTYSNNMLNWKKYLNDIYTTSNDTFPLYIERSQNIDTNLLIFDQMQPPMTI